MSGRQLVSAEWEPALAAWDAALQVRAELSANTRSNYVRRVRWLAEAVDVGPWSLTVEQLDDWLGRAPWSAKTRVGVLTALRRFYAWGVSESLVDRAPGAGERPGLWLDQYANDVAPTWRDALEAYDTFLQGRETAGGGVLSPRTREGYLRHMGWLAASVDAGPWQLQRPALEAWLSSQNWSRDTRRKVLGSLRGFYAWGVAQGLVQWAPVAGLQSPQARPRGPGRSEFAPGWREPAEAFLTWLRAAKRSEGTIAQRRWHLRRLSEAASDPWSVTTQQLATWLANPDWNPNTTRVARGTVREFYRWALIEGRAKVSPAALLDPVRCRRTLPRPITDDALRVALAKSDDRTRLILLLGALAGLRRAEIASLHANQVNEQDLLVVGKGGNQRRVPMHPLLWESISTELTRRRQGRHGTGWGDQHLSEVGWLFPSDHAPKPLTAGHVGVLARRVIPEPWTTHTLRHRFATMTYAQQRDLLAVQQLLGHAKPETTSSYAAVPDGALHTAVLGATLPPEDGDTL